MRALTPPIYLLLVVLSSAELSMKSMTRLVELMVVNRAYHQSRICGKDHCNVHLSQRASDATPHCVFSGDIFRKLKYNRQVKYEGVLFEVILIRFQYVVLSDIRWK